MSDGRVASIDELLDRAVAAINRGDRVAPSALADQVLAVDGGNAEAEDLLTAPGDAGEIRRLTILFADLVDSTVLSTRVEPETYRMLVGRYREQVVQVVDRFGAMSVRPRAMACWRCSVTPPRMRTMCAGRCWRGWRSPGRWLGRARKRSAASGLRSTAGGTLPSSQVAARHRGMHLLFDRENRVGLRAHDAAAFSIRPPQYSPKHAIGRLHGGDAGRAAQGAASAYV